MLKTNRAATLRHHIAKLVPCCKQSSNTSSSFQPFEHPNTNNDEHMHAASLTSTDLERAITATRDAYKQQFTELYLCGKNFSTDQQNCFVAMHGIHSELAQLKFRTTSPSTASMRLAWWKAHTQQALQGMCPRVPALQVLAKFAPMNHISYAHFKDVFHWREMDIHWRQVPDFTMLEALAEGVHSSFLYALLDMLQQQKDAPLRNAASHLGKCLGLIQSLRMSRQMALAQTGYTYLPADLCAKNDVSEDMIARGHAKVANVVFEVSDFAKAHLDKAKSYQQQIPKDAYPAFYPMVCNNHCACC